MERKYENAEQARAVAKEALWLAWNACGGPFGMGALQDKPEASKDDVWANVVSRGDYPGREPSAESVSADYVFGRMMKLYLHINGDTLQFSSNTPRPDYQAWCKKYKTYGDLFDAAEEAIRPNKAVA